MNKKKTFKEYLKEDRLDELNRYFSSFNRVVDHGEKNKNDTECDPIKDQSNVSTAEIDNDKDKKIDDKDYKKVDKLNPCKFLNWMQISVAANS